VKLRSRYGYGFGSRYQARSGLGGRSRWEKLVSKILSTLLGAHKRGRAWTIRMHPCKKWRMDEEGEDPHSKKKSSGG